MYLLFVFQNNPADAIQEEIRQEEHCERRVIKYI